MVCPLDRGEVRVGVGAVVGGGVDVSSEEPPLPGVVVLDDDVLGVSELVDVSLTVVAVRVLVDGWVVPLEAVDVLRAVVVDASLEDALVVAVGDLAVDCWDVSVLVAVDLAVVAVVFVEVDVSVSRLVVVLVEVSVVGVVAVLVENSVVGVVAVLVENSVVGVVVAVLVGVSVLTVGVFLVVWVGVRVVGVVVSVSPVCSVSPSSLCPFSSFAAPASSEFGRPGGSTSPGVASWSGAFA